MLRVESGFGGFGWGFCRIIIQAIESHPKRIRKETGNIEREREERGRG
jgi:hypothetical protein